MVPHTHEHIMQTCTIHRDLSVQVWPRERSTKRNSGVPCEYLPVTAGFTKETRLTADEEEEEEFEQLCSVTEHVKTRIVAGITFTATKANIHVITFS